MTKERLQELIKQGATVWIDEVGEYKLDEKYCEICKINDLHGNFLGRYCFWYEYEYNNKKCNSECEIEDIEENVERGKWHWEMDTCRTERFEPPMWEDIEDYSYRFVWQKQFILLDIHKDDDDESDMSYIHIYNFTDNGYFFYKIGDDATKENYERACEIVKDLFMGAK